MLLTESPRIIPKKLIKGNEEQVFDEMQVLKELDHPNIVRWLISLSRGTKLMLFNLRISGQGLRPL